MPGGWNIDMSRFARENRPPEDYLSKSYYQIWLAGLEALMIERGLVTREEIEAGKVLHPAKPVAKTIVPDGVAADAARGGPTEREAKSLPCSRSATACGRRTSIRRPIRACRNMCAAMSAPSSCKHGCHVFADSNSLGVGENPQWLYTVTLRRPRIVGQGRRSRAQGLGRCLGILSGACLMPLDPQAGACAPPSPYPAFRATRMARCFASPGKRRRSPWRWRCMRAACSPGTNGRKRWREEIKRAQAAGDPDTGETYYRHWLATLETLVAAKGVATSDTLHRYRDAWDHAADRTPHGAPVELTKEDSVWP